jgi:SAM-dependent methyltransferase
MMIKQKPPPEDLETLVWTITWIQAFPTLLPNPEFLVDSNRENNNNDPDPSWQLLAFDAIFLGEKNRLQDNIKWKHTRDQASMEESLGYGEITIPAVVHIMERLLRIWELFEFGDDNPTSSSIVMDLGSGNGRVLLAACLATHAFDKAIGLEIVPELHEEALQNSSAWNRNHLAAGLELELEQQTTTIDFQCADFRDHANLIATANLIFIHATVFNDSLMEQLQTLCEACAVGTHFVMVTRPLLESSSASCGGSGIRTLESLRLDMNWGEATVYIQKMVGPQDYATTITA